MIEKAAKSKQEMWGVAIVGFGRKKYTCANGKESENDFLFKLGLWVQ